MTSDFEPQAKLDQFNEKLERYCSEWRHIIRAHVNELLFFDPAEHGESRDLILNCLKPSYLQNMGLYELICVGHDLHGTLLCCVHRRLSLLPCVDISISPTKVYEEAVFEIKSSIMNKVQISGIEFDDLIF